MQSPGGALGEGKQGEAQGCRQSSCWLPWAQHQTLDTQTMGRSLLGNQAQAHEWKLLQALVH